MLTPTQVEDNQAADVLPEVWRVAYPDIETYSRLLLPSLGFPVHETDPRVLSGYKV